MKEHPLPPSVPFPDPLTPYTKPMQILYRISDPVDPPSTSVMPTYRIIDGVEAGMEAPGDVAAAGEVGSLVDAHFVGLMRGLGRGLVICRWTGDEVRGVGVVCLEGKDRGSHEDVGSLSRALLGGGQK